MFKKFATMFLVLVILLTMIGCSSSTSSLDGDVAKLEAEIIQLEKERDSLKEEIVSEKIENGTAKYIIAFNIKQTHLSLDIGQHLKDSMNDISIEIPVDKEYYDSVEVGDVIDDSFRMGSFIFKGSFGNWKVTVKNKNVM